VGQGGGGTDFKRNKKEQVKLYFFKALSEEGGEKAKRKRFQRMEKKNFWEKPRAKMVQGKREEGFMIGGRERVGIGAGDRGRKGSFPTGGGKEIVGIYKWPEKSPGAGKEGGEIHNSTFRRGRGMTSFTSDLGRGGPSPFDAVSRRRKREGRKVNW